MGFIYETMDLAKENIAFGFECVTIKKKYMPIW